MHSTAGAMEREKLNPKTAKIDTGNNFWKVYYENITKADDMEAELVKNKIFIDM